MKKKIVVFLGILCIALGVGIIKPTPTTANAEGASPTVSLKVEDVFLDYAQTSLVDSLNSYDKICAYEQTLSNLDEASLDLIDRAKRVALGNISFNKQHEFSTNPSSENVIARYGDIASYCRNDLQMSSFGTNRQVTGIWAKAGQQINIFVTASEGDPLPKVRFSQHQGSWQSWCSGENQLKLGKNTFTVPDFYHSSYSIDVVRGGAIYISNPYTSSQQSENVKVYIEGGVSFPVLKAGVDEQRFKQELAVYASKVNANPDSMINILEIVTDHTIVSVQATKGNELYQNYSPVKTIESWNSYMDKLLEFGGVTQDSTNPLFDERNLHINCNIRIVQPWGGVFMFAAGEHIGIQQYSQNSSIYGSGFGWGVTHEIGHALDNRNRIIGETTNNMYAKFNETAIEKANTRGEFSNTLNTLSNDLTYASSPYFTTKTLNYLVWWYLEGWQKGFWGNLENCYRGIYPKLVDFLANNGDLRETVTHLRPTELQVFYSSIVLGVDMSYYFERWGYTIRNNDDDPVFKVANTTAGFQTLMARAASSLYVDNTKQYKLWYQPCTAYHDTDTSPIYSAADLPSIKRVIQSGDGYNIYINHLENANHLGYEIWQGNDIDGFNVIGFSYDSSYTDTTQYPAGYTPTYKVVAVDKAYHSSNLSPAKTIENNTEFVCQIGSTGFTSLQQAISSASAGDSIQLLKSFEDCGVVVDKNITIELASSVTSDIVISKLGSGHLISIAAGASVTISGTNFHRIVLDGNNLTQTGCLISISGVLSASYITMQNAITTGNGGAVIFQNNAKGSTLSHCQFDNIRAKNGIVACEYANVNATLTDCHFTNNVVSNNGVIFNKGTLTLNNTIFNSNQSSLGIIYNYAGGVMYLNTCDFNLNSVDIGCLYLDGLTIITGGSINTNSATQSASGIYFSAGNSRRTVTLENVSISNDIVLAAGNLTVKNNCNIFGKIFISNGANFVLQNGVFAGFIDCNFTLVNFVDNMQILTAQNYTLTDGDKQSLNLSNSLLGVNLADNKLLAYGTQVVLTLNINGSTQTFNHTYGEVVELEFDLPDNTYVTSMSDADGNTYAFGDSLTLLSNISISCTTADKLQVTFNYGDNTQIVRVIPYQTITLPDAQSGSIKLRAWGNSSGTFGAGETIVISQNVTFDALYEQMFSLTVIDGDKTIYSRYYHYDDIVDLSQLDVTQPDYWTLDGTRVSNVLIQGDTTVHACHNPKKMSIISILTIILVVSIAIGLIIFWLYHKHKNKTIKHI